MTPRASLPARPLLALALSLLVACGAEPSEEASPARTSSVPSSAPSGLAAAKAEFDDPILDFGTVSDTEDIVGSFPFRNVGTKALIIGEIKPSCGCTTVELEKDRFEPGEGSAIDVVWKPKGFGVQTKTLLVHSNSADQPLIQLVVRAEIEPFARFQPSPLRPGYQQIGEEHRFTSQLFCADPDFELLELRPTHPAVSASAGTRTEGGGLPVEVVIGADAPWGMFNCSVRARLRGRPNGEGQPIEHTVDLPVNVSLFGELRAQPTLFAVGHVLPGNPFTRKVELRRGSGEPFEVTSVEVLNAQPPDITPRLERVDAGTEQGWTLHIDGESKDYLGLIRATVRFETDVPGELPRTIQVMGIVRE